VSQGAGCADRPQIVHGAGAQVDTKSRSVTGTERGANKPQRGRRQPADPWTLNHPGVSPRYGSHCRPGTGVVF
jgi:hypothetical protein